MKLFPYDTFTIQTLDSLPIVLNKLSANVEPQKTFRWSFSHNQKPYEGTIFDTGFEIHRIIHYRNSFLPRIQGQFESSATGTTVRITQQLHPFVLAFLGFWFFIWYGISIPITLAGAMPTNIAIGFLGMPILLLVAFWSAFWYEAYRSRRDLLEMILGRTHRSQDLNSHINLLRAFQVGAIVLGTAFGLWQLRFASSPPTETIPPTAVFCADNPTPPPECQLSVVRTLSGHPLATTLAMSPQHQILVSGGRDKAMKVWDLETGELRTTLQSDSGEIRSIAISPDGNTIVSGSGDRMVRIWSLVENRKPIMLAGHTSEVDFVRMSPDGKTIISGSYGEVKLWDLATGKLKTTLPNLPQWKRSIGPVDIFGNDPNRFNLRAISADSKTAIFDFIDGKVAAWDLTTNQQKFLLKERFDGFSGYVLAASLSPDGKFAAVQYSNASKKFETRLKVWDLTTGTVIARGSLAFNRSTFVSVEMAVSSDRFFGCDRNQLKIWNLKTAQLEAILDLPWMRSLVVTPDGQWLAGISGDAYLKDAKIQILRHLSLTEKR